MKAILTFIFIGISAAYPQDFLGQLFPIDSAGKWALANNEGFNTTGWKRYDKIKTQAGIPFIVTQKYGKLGLADTALKQLLPHRFKKFKLYGENILAETHTSLLFLSPSLDTLLELTDVSRYEIIGQNENSRYFKNSNRPNKMIVHSYDGCGILEPNLEWFVPLDELDDAFYQDKIIYTRKGNQFGFIANNETVIEPTYSSISTFNNKVFELQDENGHRHYFTERGEAFPYTDSTLVYDYLYGYFKIYQNGKGEIYNYKMEKMVQHNFDDVYQINSPYKYHGMQVEGDHYQNFKYEFAFLKNGKIGVCNEAGEVIIPAIYEHIDAAMKDRYIFMKDGKFGVIDRYNNVIIQPHFTFIQYHYDYFRVVDGHSKGIMNVNGESLVPVKYKEVKIEKEGFLTLLKGKKGFYSLLGEKILDNVYDQAFRRNGGLELVAEQGTCMVGQKGLLTPKYCSEVSRSTNRIKYYYQGKIHIGEIQDNQVVNTTIYPMPKSTKIEDRWQNTHAISFYQSPCKTFIDQLNSKYGSKKVRDTTWAVAPTFTNYFELAYGKVKEPHEETIQLAGNMLKTKEKMKSFDGDNGYLGSDRLSHQDRMSSRTWHSSDFDPELKMDQTFEYYSNNYVSPGNHEFIYKRRGFNSVAISEGSMNMQEGQDVIGFRDFYFDLNDCHNFKIDSKRLFSKLSSDPNVKVKNPRYKVIMIEENHTYRKLGEYKSYQELKSGAFMVQYDDNSWNIIVKGKERLFTEDVEQIEIIQFDEFEFYRIHARDENGRLLTYLYNGGGSLLGGKGYQSIEVVDFGTFKVETDTSYQWIDNYDNKKYEIIKADMP